MMFKHFKVDNLDVYVYGSRAEMGRAAYELYRDKVNGRLLSPGFVRAIFAAAHSQDEFLDELCADRTIDFARMDAFHMDEYFGLGVDAPQNFGNFLQEHIWRHQPFHSVNRLRSDAEDLDQEARRYEALVKAARIDITSLGIGENGHIAFNDPHEADFADPRWVRTTSLDVVCRQQQVNDGEFPALDDVPQRAFTLTIPALMSSRSLVCIVPGVRKAWAVRETLEGPVSPRCPASIMRTHPDATLFLDADAASMIL